MFGSISYSFREQITSHVLTYRAFLPQTSYSIQSFVPLGEYLLNLGRDQVQEAIYGIVRGVLFFTHLKYQKNGTFQPVGTAVHSIRQELRWELLTEMRLTEPPRCLLGKGFGKVFGLSRSISCVQ